MVLPNKKMQLTSGGLNGALRAPLSSRRLQLIFVLCGRLGGRACVPEQWRR